MKAENYASKQDYEYVNKIKGQIDKMTVPSEIPKKVYLRTADCEMYLKHYKLALQAFKDYEKANPTDPDAY